jgi:hypothetical protein
MRTEKFINKAEKYDMDDIGYAFKYNNLGPRLDDIDVVVGEVCGANDEYYWYWILQMKDNTFSWAKGWCDYTGWDCQSGAEINDGYKTAYEAIDAIVIKESESRKNIKEILHNQINGKIPFAIYQ